jgi:hypothetical protein
VTDTVALLVARAPKLQTAVRDAKKAGYLVLGDLSTLYFEADARGWILGAGVPGNPWPWHQVLDTPRATPEGPHGLMAAVQACPYLHAHARRERYGPCGASRLRPQACTSQPKIERTHAR